MPEGRPFNIPFQGGVNTVTERVLLSDGKVSVKQNLRDTYPGFEGKKGSQRLHTSPNMDAVTSLYQYTSRDKTKHLYAQAGNAVYLGDKNPPDRKAGAFSTSPAVLPAVPGALKPSWCVFNDYLIFSDGVRKHQIYSGEKQKILRCLVYIGKPVLMDVVDSCPEPWNVTIDEGTPRTGHDLVHYTIYSTDRQVGQALTLHDMLHISRIRFRVAKVGNPTGSAYAKLYRATGTVGSDAIPTGSALATSEAVDVSTFPTYVTDDDSKFFDFDFANAYLAAPGDYCVVFEYPGGDSSNYVKIAVDQVAAKNELHYGNGCRLVGGSFVSDVKDDCLFYLYALRPLEAVVTQGRDYTDEVTDPDTTRVAVLGNLRSWSNTATDCVYIATPIPATKLNFVVQKPNSNVSAMKVHYFNGGWREVSGLSDGTSSGGATLSQSGSVTWTAPTDEIPTYLVGKAEHNAYWYRVVFTAALDLAVTVSEITYESDGFVDLVNVWDGNLTEAIEVKVLQAYKEGVRSFYTYGFDAVALCNIVRTGGETYDASLESKVAWYAGFMDPIVGVYIDTGSTPNITKAVATASSEAQMVFDADSKKIYWEQGDFFAAGFRRGMKIEVANTANNNGTFVIESILGGHTLYLTQSSPPIADETSSSATIVYEVDPTLRVFYWSGVRWEEITCVVDGTEKLTKSGFITWRRLDAQPRDFENTRYYAYWYKFQLSEPVAEGTTVAVYGMPWFDKVDMGNGLCSTAWHGCMAYVFDRSPNYIHVASPGSINHLNGAGYRLLQAGDGRRNKIVAVKSLPLFIPYEEYASTEVLLAWQEETDVEGGTVTAFTMDKDGSVLKRVLSERVGALNADCVDIAEGIPLGDDHPALAFFLSKRGVFLTDGRQIRLVSSDIQNYFDPKKEECIRRGYENKMWLKYDATSRSVYIGLVSGNSATQPNVFPVLNCVDWTWSFDTYVAAPCCLTEAEAASGEAERLLISGREDGFVCLENHGVLEAEGIFNNGFETGDFSGWTQNNAVIDDTDPHSGTYCAKLEGAASTIDGVRSDAIPVDETVPYAVSLWTKVPVYKMGEYTIYVNCYSDVDGTLFLQYHRIVYQIEQKDWMQHQVRIGPGTDYAFPSGTKSIRILQRWEGTTLGSIGLLDDVYVGALLPSAVAVELDGKGANLFVERGILRCKALPQDSVDVSVALDDSNNYFKDGTYELTPVKSGDVYKRFKLSHNYQGTHLSFKFEFSSMSERIHFLDLSLWLRAKEVK